MKALWTWNDYELLHSPTIEYGDYRIKAYGRDEEIQETVDELANYARNSTRMLRRLVAYWGSGKSTYLYNICHSVNQRLLFGDEVERPEEGDFTHVLAFFEIKPARRVKLLEPIYNDGLPWVWDTKVTKSQASQKGIDAWKDCVRHICFVLLRKATHEIQKRHLEEAALGGSKLRKDVYQGILELGNLKTSAFIQKLGETFKTNDQVFEECGELMRFYFRLLLPSFEAKKGNKRVVIQETIEQFFPQFLYNCYSSKFLVAYKELFSVVDMNLRYFPAFERILKAAQTFLLLVFDEVEDWSAVVQNKIDDDVHDIAVDAESQISLVLIFRSEVLRKIRSDTTLRTFMTIHDRLENMELRQLDKEDFIAITAGILDTARKGPSKIFPLTESFVEQLATLTRRGKSFNVRAYLLALKPLLEQSLEWKREKVELTEDMLEQKKAEEIIKEALRTAEQEASKFATPKGFEE